MVRMSAPRGRSILRLGRVVGLSACLLASCKFRAQDHRDEQAPLPTSQQASVPPAVVVESSSPTSATNPPSSASPSSDAELAAAQACPSDMVLVEGSFCPEVEQRCASPEGASLTGQAMCREFHAPSRCLSARRELKRFCIDRYEWPNRAGVRPQVLTQWTEARALCSGAGKRLCRDTEWLFACEGEAMLPYTYGYVRDPTICVLDRLYIEPGDAFLRWDACLADPACKARFARLDQREPAGASAKCVSPFGVFDMNGNVNEWVEVPGATYPKRSGLKGGWWGPVRNRCRPTVRFHKEDDWGYEVGFRCCEDATP
jgi:formylglycine-generating enzyme